MNQVQREIWEVQESLKPALQGVLERYQRRKSPEIYRLIQRPCQRLLQKCSCKSLADASLLCQLAYWLAIDGEKELALQLCQAVRKQEPYFEPEAWAYGLQPVFGLEIRLARQILGQDRRRELPVREFTFSKQAKKRARYPQALREERIAQAQGGALQVELFGALCDLIGLGETGLYSQLNQHWDQVEQAIQTYSDWLKQLMLEE